MLHWILAGKKNKGLDFANNLDHHADCQMGAEAINQGDLAKDFRIPLL